MRTRAVDLRTDYGVCRFNAPTICPCCGIAGYAEYSPRRIAPGICVMVCTCQGCDGLYYVMYRVLAENDGAVPLEMLYMYPAPFVEGLPECVRELSPQFVKAYGQASNAQSRGDFELASCGFRNAAEILIKDYAGRYEDADDQSLRGKSLDTCITEYLTEPDERISAYIVKQFGNISTHYPKPERDIDFTEFREWFDRFLETMTWKIRNRDFLIRQSQRVLEKLTPPHE